MYLIESVPPDYYAISLSSEDQRVLGDMRPYYTGEIIGEPLQDEPGLLMLASVMDRRLNTSANSLGTMSVIASPKQIAILADAAVDLKMSLSVFNDVLQPIKNDARKSINEPTFFRSLLSKFWQGDDSMVAKKSDNPLANLEKRIRQTTKVAEFLSSYPFWLERS